MARSETVTYHGQVLHIVFATRTDLTLFMPDGLLPLDPYRGFVKVQRMKMRSQQADADPPAFSHYNQVGIATLAEVSGHGARHRNFLLWEDRPWAIGSTMAGAKRYGHIEMTQVYETERARIAAGEPAPFRVDVTSSGFELMRFAGLLDGVERTQRPPYDGFYVGGEPGSDLLALTLDTARFSRPIEGTGALAFGQAPNERASHPGPQDPWPATLLEGVEVLGCVLEDFTFTRSWGQEFTRVRDALR